MRIVDELLVALGDGRWHNLCSHEVQTNGDPIAFFKTACAAGIASGRELVEVDDTWARLTPKGVDALRKLPSFARP